MDEMNVVVCVHDLECVFNFCNEHQKEIYVRDLKELKATLDKFKRIIDDKICCMLED